MNNIFKKIANDAKLSYVKITKVIRTPSDPLESETYTGTPEQFQTFSEIIVKQCAELARLHEVNDTSLTTQESLMSVQDFLYYRFGMK